MYNPDGRSATSVSDGTNLPNLAEIYYLYYDVCVDRESGFDKSNLKPWTALRGQFQFCVQQQEADTSVNQFTKSKLLNSTTDLDWYKTIKNNTTAFCTKVEGEKDDFCIAESVMQGLSIQMGSIFNTSATFSDMNRTDIEYSTEWGPRLARAIFGGTSDTEPLCPVEQKGNGWGSVIVQIGEYGFQKTLAGIAHSLSDA